MSQQSNINLSFFQKKSFIIIVVGIIVFGTMIYFLYNKLYKKYNKPVDCKLSDWIWDDYCTCEGSKDRVGKKFANRNIIEKSQYGGKDCPTDSLEFSKYISCNCPTTPFPTTPMPTTPMPTTPFPTTPMPTTPMPTTPMPTTPMPTTPFPTTPFPTTPMPTSTPTPMPTSTPTPTETSSDCIYSDWRDSGECNLPCGGGQQGQIRTGTTPHDDPSLCLDTFRYIPCNTQACPINTSPSLPGPDELYRTWLNPYFNMKITFNRDFTVLYNDKIKGTFYNDGNIIFRVTLNDDINDIKFYKYIPYDGDTGPYLSYTDTSDNFLLY
jgi:hypothetical protein